MTTSYLKERNRHFVSTSCEERHSKTNLFGYNLGESTENNKALLFFSGKEQIKLLAVPFKSSRCCLRSDKLVNYHVWKFYKDLFLNCRVSSWPDLSIKSCQSCQSIKSNGFLSHFVEITSCLYTKTIILFNLCE